MPAGSSELFGENLVRRGIISQKQLDEAIHKKQTTMSHRKLGEILVRLGYISREHITETLAQQLGLTRINLRETEIPDEVIELVDREIATIYHIVPVRLEGDVLYIATADPTNIELFDDLWRLLGRPVEPLLSTVEHIREALARYYKVQESTVESMLSTMSSASTLSTLSGMSGFSSMSGLSSLSDASQLSADSMSTLDFDDNGKKGKRGRRVEVDEEGPVIRYVQNLITEAFRRRASDIHVEPEQDEFKVRYRIDGVLHHVPAPAKKSQAAVISRIKILAGMDIAERRVPQDGRIKLNMMGKDIDLRVSSLPGLFGESVVMRILDKSGLMMGLGELGFAPSDQAIWEQLLAESTGVVIVSGPTGSGKTTTLYASLHNLNTQHVKLITVENPVEYQLEGINQVQINEDIGLTFGTALRSIFRQDPDVVMIGEIRDGETAEIAVKAALTGHLVFSTLHTNDAPATIIRLVDIGVKPFLVAAAVRAILAQRLVRVVCPTCKEPYRPTDEELELMGPQAEQLSGVELFRGKGCENCNGTGYQGRVGLYELLTINEAFKEKVLLGASATELRRVARRNGMKTLREDGVQKILNGITTISEVARITQPDEALSSLAAG